MKLLLNILFLSILIICSKQILGQNQDLRFKSLSTDNGLSQNWVRCINQDSQGFLWFGTGGNGINKYDGYKFKVYKNNTNDKNSLTNNWINTIYIDKKQRLWVGTQKGLNYYDRDKDRFLRFPYIQSEFITGLFESNDNKLYVITPQDIYQINFEEKTLLPYIEINNAIASHFYRICEKDKNGNLLIGSTDGLYIIDLINRTHIVLNHDKNNPNSISDDFIQSIYRDSKDRIWIGTLNGGLNLMIDDGNKSKISFVAFSNDPNNNNSINKGTIWSILDDRNGKLYIGLENEGVDILDLNDFEKGIYSFKHVKSNIYDNSSLSSNSINSIFEDNQGTIWIGTYNSGISYYNKLLYKFEHLKHIPNIKNSLINNVVNVFFEDGDDLWIGTEGGISILNKKKGFTGSFSYNPNDPNSLGSNSVWSIFKDSRNNIWVGTWAGGLNLYNKKSGSFTRFLYNNTQNWLTSNNIFAIEEDETGNLWLATMGGGLNRFNYKTNEFKAYRTDNSARNSISGEWVQTLLTSSKNELWISTTDGVDIFDKKTERFTTFINDTADKNSISYIGANVIFEDSKKNIWLGTDGGLNLFLRNDSSFICYNEENGLPDNSIKGICEDNKGNLWLSTNNGISKFYNGINHPDKPIFKNYNKSDGLQNDEFNRHSVYKLKDGNICFGGNNGFNFFQPDSIKENTLVPNVILTNLQIFNKLVKIGAEDSPLSKQLSECTELKLSYKYDVFTIEFTALNYISPEKNQYAYIMEGFEKEWNYVGNKHDATYTNLAPGKYTFRVKASNNDGYWNTTGTSIKIIILPPWWRTIWFRILLIILVAIGIAGFFKLRLNALRKQKKYLEKIVSERTLEIEQKNRVLEVQTGELYEVNSQLEERNQYIEEQNYLLIDKTQKLDASNVMLIRQKGQIEEQAEVLQAQTDYLLEVNKLLQESQKQIEKQSEELKVTNEQLKTLNATKDKFFSIIAHDLKNPFNNIMGFTEMLISSYEHFDDEKRKNYINIISESSKNIFKLLENLLQWARSQTGKIAFEPEEFMLPELVNSNKSLVENMLQGKNIKFNYLMSDNVTVFADKNMINTVIRNLLTNAIKFTENGEITISAENKDTFVKVSIQDSGVGISREKLDTIFEVGATKSTKGTKGETGTGLGLIICKEFIERNGGVISVKSEEKKGTTFVFTVPAKKE